MLHIRQGGVSCGEFIFPLLMKLDVEPWQMMQGHIYIDALRKGCSLYLAFSASE